MPARDILTNSIYNKCSLYRIINYKLGARKICWWSSWDKIIRISIQISEKPISAISNTFKSTKSFYTFLTTYGKSFHAVLPSVKLTPINNS